MLNGIDFGPRKCRVPPKGGNECVRLEKIVKFKKKIAPNGQPRQILGGFEVLRKTMKLDFSRRKKVASKEVDFYPIYGLFWKKMPEA
jgi:hypothetical protein